MGRARTAQRRDEREVEFSRIVAFSDGVFAIAITLLVLNIGVPERLGDDDLTSALWDQRHNLFAYALSFAVIGRFWIIHHRFFGDVVRFDGRLLALNLFYLSWIVLIPFSSQVLGDHGGETAAIVLYALNLAAVILIGHWMARDAWRAGLARTAEGEVKSATRRALGTAVVFLGSIPLALIDPHIAPYLWLVLFLTVGWDVRRSSGPGRGR